jgi:class 3 adenylate cyclase/pimeloyl-ACP methyl ester carboxylesterase
MALSPAGQIPQTRWARTVDGACIAYQDLGEGPVTLVVIHGWVSHLEIYWEQPRFARFMRRLAKNMRVLHFDKRGVGMSDRLSEPPGLDVQMDDVRAVMDAAGVERAAVFGWGTGGPPLACMFAATSPERVLALCIDAEIGSDSSFPWGISSEENEERLSRLSAVWGDDEHAGEFVRQGFGSSEATLALATDAEFLRWSGRFMRCAATPASYEAFDRMWYATDVSDALASIHVPTLVVGKTADVGAPWGGAVDYCAAHIAGARRTLVPGSEGVVWVEDPEPLVSTLETFISSVRHEESALDRMLATVMFTDVVGSTDRACEVGDACWTDLLEKHNATVRAFLARYRGTEVKTTGDGFLATFDGPARAVKCAQAICEAVKPLGLEVRAGCHTGEIEMLGDAGAGSADVGGIAVHIGARVGALAGPSEVLVSSTVKDLVAGSGLVFEDRGEHELKGVPEPWHLYAALPAVAP